MMRMNILIFIIFSIASNGITVGGDVFFSELFLLNDLLVGSRDGVPDGNDGGLDVAEGLDDLAVLVANDVHAALFVEDEGLY